MALRSDPLILGKMSEFAFIKKYIYLKFNFRVTLVLVALNVVYVF